MPATQDACLCRSTTLRSTANHSFPVRSANCPCLTAPTNVQATVSGSAVTVTWTPGQNAASHAVMVFTSDFTSTPHTDWKPGPGSTTIQNVAAGSYVVAVVAIDVNGDILYNLATVTVS